MPPRRPADLPAAPVPVPDAPKPATGENQDAPAGSGASPACLAALMVTHGTGVRAAETVPGQDAACAVVEPVVVEALTLRTDAEPRRIAFQPPVTLSCAMATVVAQWLGTSVQPLARGHFTRELTALRVGGGHECRRRNRSSTGALSEHANGRALDIFGFVIGDGKVDGTVVVEKPDGASQQRFLAGVRQSACGAFMTSLGPGSDAAHSNHLHVDIQERRISASRFCQ
ncbi:extensin family protein [Bosea sp. 124]|uniref:extensin-like domain-containing protein n=1 Tax=Bosea sp. 124 TaxID=2135642 RepID=UPI000D35D606|nr:extensin family protein [Bosea sp. 124]PTM40248.1 hypothetical protein C8D03_1761 [Bosea sp. 124]